MDTNVTCPPLSEKATWGSDCENAGRSDAFGLVFVEMIRMGTNLQIETHQVDGLNA